MGDELDTRATKNSSPSEAERGLEANKPIIPFSTLGNQPWQPGWAHRNIINRGNRFMWPGKYPSFELEGPDPNTKDAYQAVAFWLGLHKDEIAESEKRWKVDRRAIAGVIAWEAIMNPQANSFKSVGPGKIHLERNDNGDLTWPEVVEAQNKLPRQSPINRRQLMRTPAVAINYIGATLDTIAQISEHYGWNFRTSPHLLAFIYHNRTMNDWLRDVKTKSKSASFIIVPGTMGEWVQNNVQYLTAAVGLPFS